MKHYFIWKIIKNTHQGICKWCGVNFINALPDEICTCMHNKINPVELQKEIPSLEEKDKPNIFATKKKK